MTAASCAALLASFAADAGACGGFFCGQQPVDQTAERILFEVGDDSVTMTTQISYNGRAEDFAWILPLSAVPDPESLAEFPQAALSALDANSGPIFQLPQDPECSGVLFDLPASANAAPEESRRGGEVIVQIQTVVGNYQVAVIESEDPAALIEWLRDNGYRITSPMEPYIERYTEEGLKFLALKLIDTAEVSDIKPFRFTLPGTTPTIPLRMTALAAEPEMSIVVFVLGNQRYEGKNWANLEIPDNQIRYNPFSFSFPVATNWTKLVAQHVDEAGGQGWVTEFAGSSEPFAERVRNQLQGGFFPDPELEDAATQLLGVLEAHPYMTRLYTRLSAEEMTSDPVIGATTAGDVAREHQLSRFVDGIDQCSEDYQISTDPCDYATCGAGGFCRAVPARTVNASASETAVVAGCACVPGATARPTFAPDGSPTVICQDGRLSFLNPGDRETETSAALPDACAGFDCGEHGQCTAVNMTPTCVCDQGFVAVASGATSSGARGMRCVEPPELVPADFYKRRLPALPDDLPGGREVVITAPEPMPTPGEQDPAPLPPSSSFPMPRENPALASASGGGGGCAVTGSASEAGSFGWLAAAVAAGALARRRRAHR